MDIRNKAPKYSQYPLSIPKCLLTVADHPGENNVTDSKIITLTKGFETIVDADDYDWLVCKSWYAYVDFTRIYARSSKRDQRNSITIHMHRAILEHHQYDLTNLYVDHINNNSLDNRLLNLRVVTTSQNGCNQKLSKRNSSGYRGVFWDTRAGKWQAKITITVDGVKKQITGGFHHNVLDAAKKYNELSLLYHGDYGKLNIIE